MIIQSAQKALEGNAINHIDPNVQWRYLAIEVDGHVYRIVFENNPFYGDLVRQWSIDENIYTTVKDKYIEGRNVPFDVSCGLMGVRSFEKDSMVWEFLYKPLGIPESEIWKDGKKKIGMYDTELLKILERNNISYKLIKKGVF